MNYVVELPVIEGQLSRRLNDMRAWLDHRRSEPSGFRVSAVDGDTSLCRVYFSRETEAAAFAAEFGGKISAPPLVEGAILEL